MGGCGWEGGEGSADGREGGERAPAAGWAAAAALEEKHGGPTPSAPSLAASSPSPLGRVVPPLRVDRHGRGGAREHQQPARGLLLRRGGAGAGGGVSGRRRRPSSWGCWRPGMQLLPQYSQRPPLGADPPVSCRPCWRRQSPWPPRTRAAGRPPRRPAARCRSCPGKRRLRGGRGGGARRVQSVCEGRGASRGSATAWRQAASSRRRAGRGGRARAALTAEGLHAPDGVRARLLQVLQRPNVVKGGLPVVRAARRRALLQPG